MSYADFIAIVEAVGTALALVGIGLGLYLLRAERQDRASDGEENGRTGILSWALVMSESLRVMGQIIVFGFGIAALATPNPASPATPLGPFLNLLIVLFVAIGVAQSGVLIYARKRIARYVPPPVIETARQDTLIEVQGDVARAQAGISEAKAAATSAYEAANDVQSKLSALTNRANASDDRADISERRADAAEEREGE